MKTNKFFFFLLIMCGFFILSKNLYGVTDSLLAGTSKVNITPPVKEPLHDSLFARCLVLDLNGTRLAFISINNDIVIATCPGEPFIQLQIELKKIYLRPQVIHFYSATHGTKVPGQIIYLI